MDGVKTIEHTDFISQMTIECVPKSDYDTLAAENKELQTYKTDWQSIAGKANLEHLVNEKNEFEVFLITFGLGRKFNDWKRDEKHKRAIGCSCPAFIGDGRSFDGVSYGCKLHGR